MAKSIKEKFENILIKEHVWFNTKDGWGENCKYCNSYVGIGTSDFGISECNLRFNWNKFNEWLKSHNYSLIINKNKRKSYQKRFTNIQKYESTLLKEYMEIFNIPKSKYKLLKTFL